MELAEVSLWLNTMHPGMRAPWFGLHLRRGNSLIGARRWVYEGERIKKERGVAGLTPTKLPFRRQEDGTEQPLPEGAVHQFLLPTPGWGAVAGASGDAKKLVEQLAGDQVKQLRKWKSGVQSKPKATGGKSSQLARLQAAAQRVEFLWQLVAKRMELSEQEIARTIDVWGADRLEDAEEYAFLRKDKAAAGGAVPLTKEQVFKDLFEAEGSPYWRLKQVMDAWCALWFWPLDKVGLLDGSDEEYATPPVVAAGEGVDLDGLLSSVAGGAAEPTGAAASTVPVPEPTAAPQFVEAGLLFALDGDQMSLGESGDDDSLVERQEVKRRRTSAPKKPKNGGSGRPSRRAIIPLADLDDWLDFLESMLGRGPVPEVGTIAASLDSLAELRKLERLIPGETEMDMDEARMAVETRYPWMRVAREIAAEQGFLHWELDFAGVFAGEKGGFDLQVGNPPWVRPEWKEDPVLAEYEPWFMLTEKPKAEEKTRRRKDELQRPAVQSYLRDEATDTVAMSTYLAAPFVYPLVAGTRPDLYRGFMCEVWDHAGQSGTAGMLHPDAHFSGDNEAALRAAAYKRLRVHGDFVNAGNRFFPPPVGRPTHFGVHIYGSAQVINFDSLSWLYSVDALRGSAAALDDGIEPGVKFEGSWDERPHPKRIIRVNESTLRRWQQVSGNDGPWERAPLLSPVSATENRAIDALGTYPLRLGSLTPEISSGYNETNSRKRTFGVHKDQRLIDYNTGIDGQDDYHADSWGEVILKGPQIGVANPMFKQPSQGHAEIWGLDLGGLADDAVPESEYRRATRRGLFLSEQDQWTDSVAYEALCASQEEWTQARIHIARVQKKGKVAPEQVTDAEIRAYLWAKAGTPYSERYRVAWRRMIAPGTERTLYAALVPPGASHVHMVHSARVVDDRLTTLNAGFWAALPLDYFLRITGRSDLQTAGARSMPAPQSDHPLASALLLRTLRLNALTTAYADLWSTLYDHTWQHYEPWAITWPGMKTFLHAVSPAWRRDTPLRSEFARRAALVEIDALVAVWLGIDANTLIALYRSRFSIMQDFDRVTWFDSAERKIAAERNAYGFGQTKQIWAQFEAYTEAVGEPSSEGILPADPATAPPADAPVPDGYTAPFYKADREREMRAAHAYFKKRLDEAVALGRWDPVKMEVPAR